MNKYKNDSIFSVKRYFIIFFLIAFVVTANFVLFLRSFDLSPEILKRNAPITFGNVLFMSLLFCIFDGVHRKLTIERPVKRILSTTNQLSLGNFNARIKTKSRLGKRNEFDVISENINRLAEELNGIETLRTDFVSDVSHEIKTPLAVINNYVTMLEDNSLSEEQRLEYLKIVRTTIINLSDLISNILKLNKLENQQIFPTKKSYYLSEQLCESLLLFEEVWEEKNIEVITDIDEDVRINADKDLLALVWNNLLSNAFKFTENGGEIYVSLRDEEGFARVSIKDTGCGIDEEARKHIFDKFYQGDTSRKTKGNGLGLALVKRVIDICDAEIYVNSTVGEGSIFTVRIKKE